MAFEAGAITGRVDLDTVSFHNGINEMHTHAEGEGGRLREIFESISEVLYESLGPALGQVGQKMEEAFAGFAEGPIIGALNAVGVAMGEIREMTEAAGEQFDEMGIAAKRAGVDVEWFSGLAGVGQTVGLDTGSLTNAFRILEDRAEQAKEGTKEAIDGFGLLGISAAQAAGMMDDPQKLFERVQTAIQSIHDPSLRTAAALEVMGRQGSNLIPLLEMSQDEFNKTEGTVKSLGGTVSESDARWGETFAKLETYLHAAKLGIERTFGTPILDYFEHHLDGIVNKMAAAEHWIAANAPVVAHAAAATAGGAALVVHQTGLESMAAFLAGEVLRPAAMVLHGFSSLDNLLGSSIGHHLGIKEAGYVPDSVKGATIPALPSELTPHYHGQSSASPAAPTTPPRMGPPIPASLPDSLKAEHAFETYQTLKAAFEAQQKESWTGLFSLTGLNTLLQATVLQGTLLQDGPDSSIFAKMEAARGAWLDAAHRASADAVKDTPHPSLAVSPIAATATAFGPPAPQGPQLAGPAWAVTRPFELVGAAVAGLQSPMADLAARFADAAPTVQEFTRRLSDLLDDVERRMRSRGGTAHTPAGEALGPPAPARAGETTINVGGITTAIDPATTANMIARRIEPSIEAAIRQELAAIVQSFSAGSAMQRSISATMGGGT